MTSRGHLKQGTKSTSFPSSSGRGVLDGLEDALAHTPVFAGIAQPPQQMPACLKGAG